MVRLIIALTTLFVITTTSVSAAGPRRFHEGQKQQGKASWYGADQQGSKTASGEKFDLAKFTAAHRYLPFGTIVRVTNCSNGLSVDVRINDRGPFGGGRIIDVSSAAADVLQMKKAGIVPVEIEIITLGSPGKANHE